MNENEINQLKSIMNFHRNKILEEYFPRPKMQIKFKKLHQDAKAPVRATDGSAGWDLTAVSRKFLNPGSILNMRYNTGIAVEIPQGYVGLLFPRSSCYKKEVSLVNSVGVLDSDYRGEISLIYKGLGVYKVGDRIGQLVIVPCPDVEMVEVDELSETERGAGGFGSTGK